MNRDGERGGEVPADPHAYRVLVAGGSQAEGDMLDQDTTWPGALQVLLEHSGALSRFDLAPVHVGSVARSGVGAEALDLMLAKMLPRYPRLDLIIVMVGATDVLRWLELGAPDDIPAVRVTDVFRCHPESRFGWTPRQLATGELVRRARHRLLRPTEVNVRTGRWVLQARTMRARATEIRTGLPDPTPMLEQFEVCFRRVLRRASAHADRVLVVRQPWVDCVRTPEDDACLWHGGVGQVWREDVRVFYSFDVCHRLMALVDARAAAIARALAVDDLDLMPVLVRSRETFYDGFHLTPIGAWSVAHAVADAVCPSHLERLRHGQRRWTAWRVGPDASRHDLPVVSPVTL